MPEYLAPGVYVEETSFRAKSIEGVATSTTGFVGQARFGPVGGPPVLVTSFEEFRRRFGGLEDLVLGGRQTTNYLSHAVKAFFENGGKRVHVANTAQGDEAKGLAALGEVEEIAIVAAPCAAALEPSAAQELRELLVAHCERHRDRFAILSAGRELDNEGVLKLRSRFDSAHAALYHPWVVAPGEKGGEPVELPPDGFVAGIYARSDLERGVHAAPANEVVQGARRFSRHVDKADLDVLQSEGVNCLALLEGRDCRVWGARTLSTDPEWKYLNVRRLLAYLQQSIDLHTQWVVFEPNDEPLWCKVRATIESFLNEAWRSGALLGEKSGDAFFVRCDRGTMSQDDLDNGRLICHVGFAPIKPAEFVVFRIQQRTLDAS